MIAADREPKWETKKNHFFVKIQKFEKIQKQKIFIHREKKWKKSILRLSEKNVTIW